MDSLEYVEMCGCDRLLEKVEIGEVRTPWETGREEKLQIVREFLSHRYQELKEKQ